MSITHKTLENALEIVQRDVDKIKKLAESEDTLDRAEANKLTDYIKALIAVHKEEREQIKSENLLSKSDSDLEDLAKQALEFLNQDNQEDPKDTQENKTDEQKPSNKV